MLRGAAQLSVCNGTLEERSQPIARVASEAGAAHHVVKGAGSPVHERLCIGWPRHGGLRAQAHALTYAPPAAVALPEVKQALPGLASIGHAARQRARCRGGIIGHSLSKRVRIIRRLLHVHCTQPEQSSCIHIRQAASLRRVAAYTLTLNQ